MSDIKNISIESFQTLDDAVLWMENEVRYLDHYLGTFEDDDIISVTIDYINHAWRVSVTLRSQQLEFENLTPEQKVMDKFLGDLINEYEKSGLDLVVGNNDSKDLIKEYYKTGTV